MFDVELLLDGVNISRPACTGQAVVAFMSLLGKGDSLTIKVAEIKVHD